MKRDLVNVWSEKVVIPTYQPAAADVNPMFLERRVYQGSSGKIYPLPFVDRIETERVERVWDVVYLENEFVRVMLLPEMGGRVHAILDKTNGYDLIYKQEVIKPALVGLAGPWASGGIEFNWPQHHRPATYMPADVEIEKHADGSATAWMSQHDPMTRMKGMHGVCLHPGKSYVELKVRLYNRNAMVQTFLWWANVGVRVHEKYQSFFPPDVHAVADHAKRAMSRYPICEESYYGVDYASRASGDLSWYANIPVPTSYMCVGSKENFLGGYDYEKQAGIVHVANHHIAPGKKQWTWGNHEFGYAWDRNLSEDAGPYIELMAGVYTDNQPDFSYLMPGETKTFSQYWYPIREIGVVHAANLEGALHLSVEGREARVGVCATRRLEKARVKLIFRGKVILSERVNVSPDRPFTKLVRLPVKGREKEVELILESSEGREILRHQPAYSVKGELPAPATEPAMPGEVVSADELYTIGLHLQQYRHATRSPEEYWREAVRRDPLDSRCNNALGLACLRRGEFGKALNYFRSAIQRLISQNPNPYDGEAYYNLGLVIRYLGDFEEAYAAFYKATWNYAWQSAGHFALAEMDCRKRDWAAALDHLERSLSVNADHLKARNLQVIVLRKLGRADEAEEVLRETMQLDPLDFFARWLNGEKLTCDTQVRLDLAGDLFSAYLFREALNVLEEARPEAESGTEPLVHYYRGYIHRHMGEKRAALRHFKAAAKAPMQYCFPARVEEILILQSAMVANPRDAHAPYYLGNLFYDRQLREEAIRLWEYAVGLNPGLAVAWRNLGMAYFNVRKNAGKAKGAYEKACRAAPDDARLLFERDQLWKRICVTPGHRLVELEKRMDLVESRDDLSVELCAIYNLLGRHSDALGILSARTFQPWEGGEGQALSQYVRAQLGLGQEAMEEGDAVAARWHFERAVEIPLNLGEARHLLANQSDIQYFLGSACAAMGDQAAARRHFTIAAETRGDFQNMSWQPFSEMTYFSALALKRLGKKSRATKLLKDLLAYAKGLQVTPAKIDYFATSLPTMLLFDDDLQRRQETTGLFLQAQALLGLGKRRDAGKLLVKVRKRDPNYSLPGMKSMM
ncbi:MAG TPA: DUF5107 domain-containing protein [Tepidisphaeraceae bacterium]|jgi:tetratricopeptide (TPR) repeat protein|nr:DUF5107 domain-containing protein [Tepidisphaeraceae bacterium]